MGDRKRGQDERNRGIDMNAGMTRVCDLMSGVILGMQRYHQCEVSRDGKERLDGVKW